MAAIEAEGLRRTYKTHTGTLRRQAKEIEAVRGIDFEVPEGELFGLLGPNGAGKTTTIKMLITLLIPTARRARGRDQQRDQHLDRGRLAGAVRAEQAEELALGHLEVDPAHGLDLLRLPAKRPRVRLVGSAEPLGFDRRHRREPSYWSRLLHSAARGGVAQLVR